MIITKNVPIEYNIPDDPNFVYTLAPHDRRVTAAVCGASPEFSIVIEGGDYDALGDFTVPTLRAAVLARLAAAAE